MTNEDAVKWLENLKQDIGKPQHSELWHYEQTLVEIGELLKKQQGSSEPMQLQYSEAKEEYYYYESICPSCGCLWITGDNKEQCFCPHCGQKVIE